MKMFKFFGMLTLMVALLVGLALLADNTAKVSKAETKTSITNQIEGVDLAYAGHGEHSLIFIANKAYDAGSQVKTNYISQSIPDSKDIFKADVPLLILRC